MRETTNRADDERLAAISPVQAARFRSAFESARYTQEFIADSMGGVEVRSRGGRNMPRLLRLTGTGSPLHSLYRLFMLGVPVLEKILRAAIVYVFLIVGLRLAGKRELAQLNPFDLVVLLTLSNTVQNAIIGNDNSVTGGIIGSAAPSIQLKKGGVCCVNVSETVPALRGDLVWLLTPKQLRLLARL